MNRNKVPMTSAVTGDTLKCLKTSMVEVHSENLPLASPWSFWYFESTNSRTWLEGQKYICTLHTKFDILSVLKFFVPASKIVKGCDYSLFRHGIIPMWEDAANINGGRWMFYMNCEEGGLVDPIWWQVCCFATTGDFNHKKCINGVAVSHRYKAFKLSVWLKNCSVVTILRIGHHLRQTLGLGEGCLKYESHQGPPHTNAKPIYCVL